MRRQLHLLRRSSRAPKADRNRESRQLHPTVRSGVRHRRPSRLLPALPRRLPQGVMTLPPETPRPRRSSNPSRRPSPLRINAAGGRAPRSDPSAATSGRFASPSTGPARRSSRCFSTSSATSAVGTWRPRCVRRSGAGSRSTASAAVRCRRNGGERGPARRGALAMSRDLPRTQAVTPTRRAIRSPRPSSRPCTIATAAAARSSRRTVGAPGANGSWSSTTCTPRSWGDRRTRTIPQPRSGA
jgi:hypothetical protein